MLKSIFLLIVFTILLIPVNANEQIPQWVYAVYGWWEDKIISDEEFENNLKFLKENNIIKISAKEYEVDKIILFLQESIISKDVLSPDRWVQWNGTISWEMFERNRPYGVEFGAYTTTIIHVDYNIRPISGKNCVFEIVNISAEAYLDKENSWITESMQTQKVLEHEKGHFDLAKIHAKKLNDKLSSLEGRNILCAENTGGYSEEENLEYSAEAYIRQIQDKVTQELIDKDKQYDSETRHGENTLAQLDWENQIYNILNSK